ncbi:MAG: polyhydroxyalkanoate synthesis repressor PhaR [Alphaproteobacteria bacterium]|nr:polyhydroxyalkanoate synthesis repressor PhaR [Alphaproteobacteria bacterium]
MADDPKRKEPIVIKKYANRRLYNTVTSAYVTLDNLCQMVKDGEEFVVRDAKTGKDLTRSVLAQIIFEEEGKGQSLLPLAFLRKLISYYGHNLEALVPKYLEASLELFQSNQDKLQKQFSEAFGEPLKQYEELGRQNLAMFERAMAMFNPFATPRDRAAGERPSRRPEAATDTGDIDELRQQIEIMRRRLDSLSGEEKP